MANMANMRTTSWVLEGHATRHKELVRKFGHARFVRSCAAAEGRRTIGLQVAPRRPSAAWLRWSITNGRYQGMSARNHRAAFRSKKPAESRAKIFRNGRSQAVRLPKAFRMPGDEVRIRREGELVILEPVAADNGWPAGYWEKLDHLTAGLSDFELPADPIPPPIIRRRRR
jgi:virulence-associated protein VagC